MVEQSHFLATLCNITIVLFVGDAILNSRDQDANAEQVVFATLLTLLSQRPHLMRNEPCIPIPTDIDTSRHWCALNTPSFPEASLRQIRWMMQLLGSWCPNENLTCN